MQAKDAVSLDQSALMGRGRALGSDHTHPPSCILAEDRCQPSSVVSGQKGGWVEREDWSEVWNDM